MRILPGLLRKAIKKGSLTLVSPDGSRETFGEPGRPADVVVRINDASLDWKIPLNPELKAAEAYMDGTLEILEGDVYDFLTAFYINRKQFDHTPGQIFWSSLSRRLKRFQQNNSLARASAHVKHHYDLKDELFDLFLDEEKQYSCAYFRTGEETLDEAQMAKIKHIARKLNLKDGQTVLEIGSGWGGMALYLASIADVKITGITLSENQARLSNQRAKEAGVSDRVSFEICDYREVKDTYDRVISVAMLEQVGAPFLKEYFYNLRNLLAPNGVAFVHSISTKSPPGITGPVHSQIHLPQWLFACIVRDCGFG